MENFARKFQETQVDQGSVAIFWLAQAGFVFKLPSGKTVYIDPYLTDYVSRVLPEYGPGFKRMVPRLIEADEVDADFVVSTHSHPDHLDVDALPGLLKCARLRFVGAPDCEKPYAEAGVPEARVTILHEGETLHFGDFSLTGVYSDHGEAAPDALGVLFDFGGIRVWHVGDTAYRPDHWQDIFARGVDIILPPINGAFGNLNGVEAAKLAHAAHAKIVIPSHFWMFPLHYGSPNEFLEACKEVAPEVRPLLLTPGERLIYRQSG